MLREEGERGRWAADKDCGQVFNVSKSKYICQPGTTPFKSKFESFCRERSNTSASSTKLFKQIRRKSVSKQRREKVIVKHGETRSRDKFDDLH